MNKITLIIIAFCLIGLSAFSLIAKAGAFPFSPYGNPTGFATPGGTPHKNGMPPGGPLGHQLRMIQSLGLSPIQEQKVRSIIKKFRPKVQSNIIALHQGRNELRSMTGYDINQLTINNLADAQGQTIASLIKLRGKISMDIRSVLTAEQKKQLSLLINKRPTHFPFNS